MKSGFYVFNPAGGMPRYVHDSRPDAEREAERLALANPGITFQVLAILGQCRKDAVIWDRVDYEPF